MRRTLGLNARRTTVVDIIDTTLEETKRMSGQVYKGCNKPIPDLGQTSRERQGTSLSKTIDLTIAAREKPLW